MLRALAFAALLATLGLAFAPSAAAETVVVGRCEVDACVGVCADVTEPCAYGKLACVTFAFDWLCTPA